jgi:hypothetical protein
LVRDVDHPPRAGGNIVGVERIHVSPIQVQADTRLPFRGDAGPVDRSGFGTKLVTEPGLSKTTPLRRSRMPVCPVISPSIAM